MWGIFKKKPKNSVPIPSRASAPDVEIIPPGPTTVPSGRGPATGHYIDGGSIPSLARPMTILPPPVDDRRLVVASTMRFAMAVSQCPAEVHEDLVELLREANTLGLTVGDVLEAFAAVEAAS